MTEEERKDNIPEKEEEDEIIIEEIRDYEGDEEGDDLDDSELDEIVAESRFVRGLNRVIPYVLAGAIALGSGLGGYSIGSHGKGKLEDQLHNTQQEVVAYQDSLYVARSNLDWSRQKRIEDQAIYDAKADSLSGEIANRDSTISALRLKLAESETKEKAKAAKPTWTYNNSYNFFDEPESKDGRVDAFNVNKGNTIAGGILELAKKEGAKLTPKQAYDLSDNVSVWRKGKEVRVDPTRLQVGDVVDFRGAVQDAIYGPKLEQRVAETPVVPSVVPFEQLTSTDLDGNGEINYDDLALFMERYHDEPQARAVNPCWDSDTPNQANEFDFYPLISKFGEEEKVTTKYESFRNLFERYKAGEFDCGEKPEGDGVKRNLVLVGLNDLALRGASTAASYDRFLNYGFGVGVQTGAFDSNPMVLGRLSYGGNNYRVGVGVGHLYTDDKIAVPVEPFLQFRLPQSKDAYGEVGVGISDFGRWKDHIEGDGSDGTKKYGFVGLKVGKRF